MEIERGNIEILFRRIPYMAVGSQAKSESGLIQNTHTYKNIDKKIYMRNSEKVFPCMSENERDNAYQLACERMWDAQGRNPSVFRMLTDISKRLLQLDGDEIRCRFDRLLYWRELSFPFGQDLFTCAYLAAYDLEHGIQTKCFTWLPIIRSNNDRLHNILNKGMAENHFHLNGSTKVFELNWVSLMNQIEGRIHDFKKISSTLQEYYDDPFDVSVKKESFYEECQRAALYRVYLFSVIKGNKYMIGKSEKLLIYLQKGTRPDEIVSDIQELIGLAEVGYGAGINGTVLDYALERSMINENDGECRILAGERRFLYDCFKYAAGDKFTEEQKDLFYAYLIIRTDFRGEIIQTNGQVGFANFSNYQDRKEYFIEGKRAYEEELVRLALNETLKRKNMRSLEARICPKDTSSKLLKELKRYERIVKEDCGTESFASEYDKLFYVLHFPKLYDKPYAPGTPRNDNVRKKSAKQARSITALLARHMEINKHIKGVDACSSEIACRPEAFGQIFRYLSDTVVVCEEERKDDFRTSSKTGKLYTTYHAGEDFLDIADGLRAIDETLLFCGFERGSRLGHALALGIEPEEYYKFKEYKIVLAKQILLDDIVWMICKAKEFGCHIESSLKTRLEAKYVDLYEDIFGGDGDNETLPSIYEYYQSWKLRGDKPELYRLGKDEFKKKMSYIELQRFDRYQLNDKISNEIRKNDRYRKLYHEYHFNKQVRQKGDEIIVFQVDLNYSKLIRKLQDCMIRQLVNMGIGIETNPSSNYLIGTIKQYDEHPILRFNSRKLKETENNTALSVSINTDDQGVFDTLLENEYALMTLALKRAQDTEANLLYDIEDIYEWVDYVRRMGIEQAFSTNFV